MLVIRSGKIVAMLFATLLFHANLAQAAEPDFQQTVAAFLEDYSKGDQTAVMAAVDLNEIRAYGSDVAEVYSGASGISQMFSNDMKLWGATAKFGPMADVSIAREGKIATIFFDAPFSVGGHPPVTVRVCMVWRLEEGTWKLIQSASSVPTVNQSRVKEN
jgi:hypothetical protein